MTTRLRQAFYAIRSSFWFLPGLMLVGAILLSWITATIDINLGLEIDREAKIWNVWIGPVGARALLNTIAGSMITVTSLVFSLTIIALTMAASNLGPRVIVYFIRDRITQVSLGLFLATFVYCLMVLLVVRDADKSAFVPYFSLATAIALSVISFGWLILFVHRVANEIQADTVVANIAEELSEAIGDVLDEVKDSDTKNGAPKDRVQDSFPDQYRIIRAKRTGYIQFISHDDIRACASKYDGYVKMLYHSGHFIIQGEPIAHIAISEEDKSAREAIASAVNMSVALGQKRTMGQDIEFAMHQLVEVGVRALSPGINDFNTAIATIDRLSGALADAFRLGLPQATMSDSDDTVRVWLAPITYDGLVEGSFNELRQCAKGNVPVTIRLMEGFTRLARISRLQNQRDALERQVESTMVSARASIDDGPDLEEIEKRYARYQEVSKKAG